jgi:TolA-binding protein
LVKPFHGWIAASLVALTLAPFGAVAQVESREGIALQNQMLELRREIDQLRRGGSSLPPPSSAPRGAGGSEIMGQLVARVAEMEEEVRRLRGRNQELEFRNQRLSEDIEKLRGDLEFRLQQLETGRPGTPRPTGGSATPPSNNQRSDVAAPPVQPPANSGPRPPERALAEGQAALARRDYTAAEAAAREVLAARAPARAQDAQILLGDSLAGRRQFQTAALAYDEAYRRNRQGARAPEALLGLSSSFAGFNARREACDTLDQLRSEFPRLSPPLAQRAEQARRANSCR